MTGVDAAEIENRAPSDYYIVICNQCVYNKSRFSPEKFRNLFLDTMIETLFLSTVFRSMIVEVCRTSWFIFVVLHCDFLSNFFCILYGKFFAKFKMTEHFEFWLVNLHFFMFFFVLQLFVRVIFFFFIIRNHLTYHYQTSTETKK